MGADSINARLVTLELPGDVLVELQPEPAPADDDADAQDREAQQAE